MLLIHIIGIGYISKAQKLPHFNLPAVCKYYNGYTCCFEMHINIGYV
jgi:hypothetical protein